MKRLLGVGVLLAALAAVLFVVPSDHYLFLPDPARPVDPLVSVPGETTDAGEGEDGGFYMVDIVVRRASLFERLFPGVQKGASLHPREAVNPQGVSESQRRQTSLNQMSRSQEIAVTVALRSLGRKVGIRRRGVEVVTVLPGAPADGVLEVGDVIVAARGERVGSPAELVRAMRPVRPGERVDLEVVRSSRRRALSLSTRQAQDDAGRAVFGVIVEQAADFRFPIDVEIDAGDIGGPSAGLAFALEVADELGRDLDGGRRIAATGELDLAGEVGTIGGIEQKTIGAREAGADLFLVPDANAAAARRAAGDDLDVVAVSSFREAISRLRGG
ncbi:MAG: PDZ domain-containing protein [Thermoleophilia bacterium]|nr:PDZ domain-containing protein [Thermoleophilia bacterium]